MSVSARFASPDELIEEARAVSGLDSLGDESFRLGLNRFLESLEVETALVDATVTRLRDQILRRLISRLRVEDWYRSHPETEQVHVGPTTSITGLPRTGTTALANIMSLDDEFRCLRTWEQTEPCPPPQLGAEANDPRRRAALEQNERLLREQPELAAMHLFDVDTTEEDVELLGMNFQAQQLALPIFNYHAWWRDCDMRPAFAYHRRVVKLLQSRRPPDRWLFKAPAHSFHLPAFFHAYPDAKVIVTHRDPIKAVTSAVSLLSALQPRELQIDLARFGPLHAEHLRVGVERALAARESIGEDRFLDLHHEDFIADPFGALERIYSFLGRELRPQVLKKMQAWHAANRHGAHGAHSYTAEQFGLSRSQLRSDFDFYIRRFDVRMED